MTIKNYGFPIFRDWMSTLRAWGPILRDIQNDDSELESFANSVVTSSEAGTWTPSIERYEYELSRSKKYVTVFLRMRGVPSTATAYLVFTLPFTAHGMWDQRAAMVGIESGTLEGGAFINITAGSKEARVYRSDRSDWTTGGLAGVSGSFSYRVS